MLTDNEIGEIWRAAGDAASPYGTIIRLLVLTGQRRGEGDRPSLERRVAETDLQQQRQEEWQGAGADAKQASSNDRASKRFVGQQPQVQNGMGPAARMPDIEAEEGCAGSAQGGRQDTGRMLRLSVVTPKISIARPAPDRKNPGGRVWARSRRET